MQNFSTAELAFCDYWDEHSILHDKKEIIDYLKKFPETTYFTKKVEGCGKFFLDNINDEIKNYFKKGQIFNVATHNAVKKYALTGSTVLDIGAHIGTETLVMSQRVGPKGKVYSFEPQKKLFRELWANCQLNKVTDNVSIYRMAIGNAHKIIKMAAPTPNNEGGTGFGFFDPEFKMFRESWTSNQSNIVIKDNNYAWDDKGDLAELRSLDSFNFDNVSLIKIDVEGNENDVIRGMIDTIKRNKPVIIIEILGWTNGFNSALPYQKKIILKTQQKICNLGYSMTQLEGHDYIAFPRG